MDISPSQMLPGVIFEAQAQVDNAIRLGLIELLLRMDDQLRRVENMIPP